MTSHASHVAFCSDLRNAIRGEGSPPPCSASIKAPEGAKGGKTAVERSSVPFVPKREGRPWERKKGQISQLAESRRGVCVGGHKRVLHGVPQNAGKWALGEEEIRRRVQ
jgi:hypothetical protein